MILRTLGLVPGLDSLLASGLRYSIFCYLCSFQEPSISLKSFALFPGANWFNLPGEAKSLTVHFLGIRCFKSGRGLDLWVLVLNRGHGSLSTPIPFNLGIAERACVFCMSCGQESMGGGVDFQIAVTQWQEGITIFEHSQAFQQWLHFPGVCFPGIKC